MSRIGALKNQKKGKEVTNEPYWRTEKPEKGKRGHQLSCIGAKNSSEMAYTNERFKKCLFT